MFVQSVGAKVQKIFVLKQFLAVFFLIVCMVHYFLLILWPEYACAYSIISTFLLACEGRTFANNKSNTIIIYLKSTIYVVNQFINW